MMAAACTSLARRAETTIRRSALCCRYTHSQSLWEELLGRKIEPAAAKKLEEAFLEYRVRKAVPSWLPFLPNCSFWIPSSEETIKNLQVLADRIKVSKPARKERANIYKSPPNWNSDQGKGSAVSKVVELSLIQQTDNLLSGVVWGEAAAPDALFKPLAEKGTIIEVALGDEEEDDDEDEDTDSEEELEVIDQTKPEGT